MKLNKTLALAALVAGSLLAGTALQAQDSTNTPPAGARPGGPGQRGRANIDQLAKDLGLSDEVKAKVKVVLDDQQTKMTELRKDTTMAAEDKRAKAKEIREATTAKLKEILTAEQLAKWQEHMQRNRPAGGPSGAGGAGAPPKQ